MQIQDLVSQALGKTRQVLITQVGSHMCGWATDDSDNDVASVNIHPINNYLGTKAVKVTQQVTIPTDDGKLDIKALELRHFCGLLLKGNLHAMEILWAKVGDRLYCDGIGTELIRNTCLFDSTRCRNHALAAARRASHDLTESHVINPKQVVTALRQLSSVKTYLETGYYITSDLTPNTERVLLAIRENCIPVPMVQEHLQRMYSQVEDIKSGLPEAPNEDAVNSLCIDLLQRALACQED